MVAAIAFYQNDEEVKDYVAQATTQLRSNVTVLDKQMAVLKDQLHGNKKREEELTDALLAQKKYDRPGQWLDKRLAELERKGIETGISRLERRPRPS